MQISATRAEREEGVQTPKMVELERADAEFVQRTLLMCFGAIVATPNLDPNGRLTQYLERAISKMAFNPIAREPAT